MASISKRDNGKWRGRDGTTRAMSTRGTSCERSTPNVGSTNRSRSWSPAPTSRPGGRTTVEEWCDTWLAGYRGKRPSTVRQAEVHILRIREAFGDRQLGAL